MSSRRGAARWSRARCGSIRAPSYEPSEDSSFAFGAGAFAFDGFWPPAGFGLGAGFALGAGLVLAALPVPGLRFAAGLSAAALAGLSPGAVAGEACPAAPPAAALALPWLMSVTSICVRSWRWPVRRL